ncbi:uncharacterized protein LOC131698003 [Acipenser ruthenus]|uniref:uncharacterized protein LOC131698003 n=1 Tax=Acipenser ruthenus TaxID=7906 RepID=UPI002740B162|nr:uncharacterized protein LOC131698003 [Acipenser ruthenus]
MGNAGLEERSEQDNELSASLSVSAPKEYSSYRSPLNRKELHPVCTFAGENVHSFLSGARYNRDRIMDFAAVDKYGLYLTRNKPNESFLTHSDVDLSAGTAKDQGTASFNTDQDRVSTERQSSTCTQKSLREEKSIRITVRQTNKIQDACGSLSETQAKLVLIRKKKNRNGRRVQGSTPVEMSITRITELPKSSSRQATQKCKTVVFRAQDVGKSDSSFKCKSYSETLNNHTPKFAGQSHKAFKMTFSIQGVQWQPAREQTASFRFGGSVIRK